MMKRVLVIGDDSYIGCKIRAWLGHFPSEYMVDIVSSRDNRWQTEADFSKYETVVNTAGLAHINNITKAMKPLFYAVNRDLPIAIAKWAKKWGVKHFIHFSSMNVYGDYCDDLKTRKREKPTSFYGDSKYQGDLGLHELEDENFKVSYIRPPFVYGKGCKGNYNTVSELAKKVPFFPNYRNKKSMIYIDNLCEFIRKVIDTGLDGVLTPQNRELVSTATLVKTIAKVNGKQILTTGIFNPFIWLAVKMSCKIRRGFGNDNYDLNLSNYFNFDYCIVSFEVSVNNTEH
jgi:UDP-glucose 4-epimerase